MKMTIYGISVKSSQDLDGEYFHDVTFTCNYGCSYYRIRCASGYRDAAYSALNVASKLNPLIQIDVSDEISKKMHLNEDFFDRL